MTMNTTLYILRRQREEISRTLFHPSDPGIEVVLVEQAGSIGYDDLVKKIFEADRTIVI
jgi:hypothetical protein